MSKKDRKNILRQAIFKKGVQALQLITNSSTEVYKCPICTQSFEQHALDARILTLEDVPPKAIGGRELVLTCRKCNNTAGHSVDGAASERQKFFQLLDAMYLSKGEFEGRAQINIGDEVANASLKLEDSHISLSILRDKNAPKVLSGVRNYFDHLEANRGVEGLKLELTPQVRLSLTPSKISDLRAAYLVAFAVFGYSYAFNNRLDLVRQQILKPEEEIISGFWSFLGQDAQKMRKLIFTSEPFEALLVIIDKAAVTLPWINGPDVYKLTSPIETENRRINFRGIDLQWPSQMQMVLDFNESYREEIGSEDCA